MWIYFSVFIVIHLRCSMAQSSPALCSYPSLKNQLKFITIDSLPENTPIGTTIAIFDIIGNKTQIRISFYPGSENLFVFNESSKSLILDKALEVTGESQNKFISDLYLNCTVIGTKSTIRYGITININDTNNHPPVFRDTPYVKILNDNTPVSSNVFVVNATDDDPSDRGALTYFVVNNSSYSTFFAFKTNNEPSLSLLQPLKFDNNITFEIVIYVKDNSYFFKDVSHITYTKILFTVYQTPDDNPVFSKSIYLTYVRDNVAVQGSELFFNPPIQSMKIDNSSLEFKLIENPINDDWQYFNFISSMQVYITKTLVKELYIFEIQLFKTTNRNRYGRATILVNVLKDILLSTSIDIFSPINYVIYDFNQISQNIKSIAFESQNINSLEYFTVAGNQFLTKKSLTNVQNYNLNFSFLLNDSLKNTTQRIILNVKVLCQPQFVQKFFSFTLTSRNKIGQLKMVQNISVFPLKYEIVQELNVFHISLDGWIDSDQDLDSGTSYSFLVNCECALGPKDTALVTISTSGIKSDFRIAAIVLGVLMGLFLLCCILLLALIIYCFCCNRNAKKEKSTDCDSALIPLLCVHG